MQTDDIIQFARDHGVIRADDTVKLGVSRTMLPYLAKHGLLRRVARGCYMPTDQIPERVGFTEIAAAAPNAVLCLLSALQFHEITTQMPNEYWLAIERGTRPPTVSGTPVQIVKLSGVLFSAGIEEHPADGITIRVYSAAKTVVDCFRFRNRIGLDVAREALVDSLAQGQATRDEIWQLARQCRIGAVMQPYLEMA